MPLDRGDDYGDRSYRHRGERTEREPGHSAIGIISGVAALLSGFAVFSLATLAGVLTVARGDLAEDSPEAILIGLGIIAGVGVALLALILGVVGLFQSGNKLFPILGTVGSSLVLIGIGLLGCAGLVAG